MPLRVGIIGYGGFGRFLRQSWSALDGVAVEAVADSNPAADPGDLRFYSSWRDLVRDPSIDLVSIVTPPATHAEIACIAMEEGKHVLIEKPLATTREDALRILRTQQATGRVAAVDYMLRFNPIIEAVHEWARSEPFGPIRRVIVENYAQDESLAPDHWFWQEAISGGILVEHSVHFIDVINGCTRAAPSEISGYHVRRNVRQTDRMGLNVVYADGLAASQFHMFSRPGFFEETTMRFVFDLAQLDVQGWIPLSGTFTAMTSSKTEPDLLRLPGVKIHERTPLADTVDFSRPKGWGDRGKPRTELQSGGVTYSVEHVVRGAFRMAPAKSEAYASALCGLLRDVAKAIADPGYPLRAGLPEGMASLEIALAASK